MLKLLIIANLALIIICVFLTFKAFPMQKRKIIYLLSSSVLAALMFLVIYPNLFPIGSVSCEYFLQSEVQNVAASIADYFSVPERTKIPTINNLIELGYIPPEKRKSPIRSYSVKESGLIVFTSGEADDEIEVWGIAAKGQCIAGRAYVYNLNRGDGKWLDSYKEN